MRTTLDDGQDYLSRDAREYLARARREQARREAVAPLAVIAVGLALAGAILILAHMLGLLSLFRGF